jgi:hypothetical protein
MTYQLLSLNPLKTLASKDLPVSITHISSFFEAIREEQAALFDLLAEMQIMGCTEMAVYESCRYATTSLFPNPLIYPINPV